MLPDAMPAGPSGPAQPGVITAVVAAITTTGTATSAAALATAPRRATGRSASDGRHSSAAQPTISPNSRTQLTTSNIRLRGHRRVITFAVIRAASSDTR